ncbi:unnamed protein product [Mycena citricolor]|uniref:DUF7223 domain-containing protein n=1 Tax=Mycena citricolor TaxID=2018698 RepID=A0AAD2HMP8_9AGAR|nr:unnamed protein product [Mycena citricolor]
MLAALVKLSLLVVLPAAHAAATNDWSVACKGNCSYDLPEGGASIHLSGGSNAVSDLTTAGGWTILSCDSAVNNQTIRAVCHSSACQHVFEGHGAVDTVVRLPESCGTAPFARVVSAAVDPDQSIPAGSKVPAAQSGSMTNTVFLIGMDVDFAAVNPQITGPVAFHMSTNSTDGPVTKRDVKKIRNNITSYNSTPSVTLPPVVVDQTFPIASASISCDGFTASVSTDFSLNVNASVTLGLTIAGTVIPANISEFAVFAGLDGKILGTLGIQAEATGAFSSGKTSLYTASIPGYSVPGIFTVGPTFTIYGQADVQLDAQLNAELDLSYDVSGARVYVPSKETPPGVAPAQSNFKLSLIPDLTANANITASLIPELAVGLDAFSGIAKAEVFLNLEADAGLTLTNFDASAGAHVTGTGSAAASGQVNGCVDIGAGFSANIGADGSLFQFISGNVTYPLYKNNWDLYNTCFSANGSTPRRRAIEAAPVKTLARRASLSCPGGSSSTSVNSLQQIISQLLQAIQGNASTSK